MNKIEGFSACLDEWTKISSSICAELSTSLSKYLNTIKNFINFFNNTEFEHVCKSNDKIKTLELLKCCIAFLNAQENLESRYKSYGTEDNNKLFINDILQSQLTRDFMEISANALLVKLLPDNMWNEDACDYTIQLFKDGKADTYKEAFNLYDVEIRHRNEMNELKSQYTQRELDLQFQYNNALRNQANEYNSKLDDLKVAYSNALSEQAEEYNNERKKILKDAQNELDKANKINGELVDKYNDAAKQYNQVAEELNRRNGY